MGTGTVYLIGAGPGDPGLFTLRGQEILSFCDTVVYDYLANAELLCHARPGTEQIYVGKKGGAHTLPQKEITRLLIALAKEGKNVARLKGGDPYLFGRGAEEAEELVDAGIAFEVVPGVSSALAATAYAGMPLTHRSFASSVCLATGHEDPAKPESAHDWPSLARIAEAGSTLVFFMGMKNLPEIAAKLSGAGLPPETPAGLVRWGSTVSHRSLASTLAELPSAAEEHGFSAPCLIIIGKVVSLHDKLAWFEKKPLLGKGVLVTRARAQASGISAGLRELGARVHEFPCIRVQACKDPSALTESVREISAMDWLIFTSANTVDFFWRELERQGKDARSFGGAKIAAVGSATARALRSRGLNPDCLPERFTAEALLETLREQGVSGQKILLPKAAGARGVLPEGLRAAGAQLKEVIAYETVREAEDAEKIKALLEQGEIQLVSFASSSAVSFFLELIPAELLRGYKDLRFACIGPITAKTLTDAGLPCQIMPEEYTIPALLEAIKRHF